MPIRQLSETVIDQIAAGEVVERPASVVKELVENALDAGATRIEIVTAGGGKGLLRITDDGCGIPVGELPLAVRRHCTSKLVDDLHLIQTLGFRGEALPSIGSVARLSLRSRQDGADGAHEIAVDGGKVEGPRPAALSRGTVVEVRDLFHAVPARLKFLKSERAEAAAVTDVIRRIAIAFPAVRFALAGSDRSELVLEPATPIGRISAVVGKDFAENSLLIEAGRENARLTGFAGIPAYSRGNAQFQYVYVNGRPVRDKMLLSALRGAYATSCRATGTRSPCSSSRSTRPSSISTSTRRRPTCGSAIRHGPRPRHRRHPAGAGGGRHAGLDRERQRDAVELPAGRRGAGHDGRGLGRR